MEWYRQVQFVSAVPMPAPMAAEFGTTVNGMWASPEGLSAGEVSAAHEAGQRLLFSVPMIALVPQVYERPSEAFLLDEVCNDIDGAPSGCDWYYWEPKPVFAACIYSDTFRRYLLDRCRDGIDRGMDVVNLDEIMTSVGLLSLRPRGCGFCDRCIDRFRPQLPDDLATADAQTIRDVIRADADLFARYRRFHDREAFRVMTTFIEDLRAVASSTNPAFAITANLAYLGNNVRRFGPLWGCVWGPYVDFVMMENDYRAEAGGQHSILPRGKFTAWYKLGNAVSGAPTWICPSIAVPRQLAGRDHRRYYELMFLEAYANGGRWGYYWWPGVDPDTRRRATAPDALKSSIAFIDAHRDLYEDAGSINDLAVLYLEGPIMRRPTTHDGFLALTQALAESGYQCDVLYCGDGGFNPDALEAATLDRYAAIMVPEARHLGSAPRAAIEAYARRGGEVIVFSESPFGPAVARTEDGRMLADFWLRYGDADRARIASTVPDHGSFRITTSDPVVNVIRTALDGRQILHLLDYAYDAEMDTIEPAKDVVVTIPWLAPTAVCRLIAPDGELDLDGEIADGRLRVEVPQIDPYAVLVLQEATS
jgi:hypothetical protein